MPQLQMNNYPHDIHDCCNFKVAFDIHNDMSCPFATIAKVLALLGYVTEFFATLHWTLLISRFYGLP